MTEEDELARAYQLYYLEQAVEKANMARRSVICPYCGCYLLMERELNKLAKAKQVFRFEKGELIEVKEK